MTQSRRTLLRQFMAGAALTAFGSLNCAEAEAEPKERVLANHLAFPRLGHKRCTVPRSAGRAFSVIDLATRQIVLAEALTPASSDLGDYRVGDLSSVTTPGRYLVQAGKLTSHPFEIAADPYLPAIRDTIAYFARQRCGPSTTGYHAPCHLDDGVRLDNGKRLDVTGGWHDACDVRKWVNATIYGMIGLARLLDSPAAGTLNARDRILDELRWGNRYFLAMQHADGYIMSHCGGDDGNDWTDNRIGTGDDRRIHTDPADVPTQYNFIAAQAAVARHTRDSDQAYSRRCQDAAARCLAWLDDNRRPAAATSLGACAFAMAALHRLDAGDDRAGRAADALNLLRMLQQTDGEIRGFFRIAPDQPEPVREVTYGNLPLIAISESLLAWPDHPAAGQWREMLTRHVDHLATLAARSAFGIVPFGLYTDRNASPRHAGPYAYRYFMKPGHDQGDSDWWVGINAHLASHGVGLLYASRACGRPDLADLAQRQLDWILGANPFDASTVSGHGHNQPPLYIPGHLKPPTPPIKGGVMNGIGGDANDQPDLKPKSWQTCEYWTPMVAYTAWLMAELS